MYNTNDIRTRLDPRYIKLVAGIFDENYDGDTYSTEWTDIPVYKCTQEDFDKFYPMADRAKEVINFYDF